MDLFKGPGATNRREIIKLLVMPTAIVLLAFWSVTLWSWGSARQALKSEVREEVTERTGTHTEAIIKRLYTYEEMLRGGVGLFYASDEVTKNDWQQFVSSFEIADRYPGVLGFGFSKYMQPNERDGVVQYMRLQGATDFSIRPEEPNRQIYTAIMYLEPLDGRNKMAVGYDMFSEPVRRAAMEQARDTGNAAISERVELVQGGDDKDNFYGFLLYLPYYDKGKTRETIEQRQEAIQGYVYAAFRSEDLFNGIFSQKDNEEIGFKVYTDSSQDSGEIYKNNTFDDYSQDEEAYTRTVAMDFHGSRWKIDYRLAPGVISSADRTRPLSTLLWGMLVSILAAALVFRLMRHRARNLAELQAAQVLLAKDDLLSLASHQLRTPATGVKQYLGMVLEGYAGPLSDDQKNFMKLAYDSNERQLHIINELLYVAKAESGRIVLSKQPLNLNKLLKEIIQEHKDMISDHGHTVSLSVPPKTIMLSADVHCLRMTVDNLLNNAIKYTKQNGKITIKAKAKDTRVMISVCDSGVGIAEKDVPHIFEKFSRVSNELSEYASGSGLGLYLAEYLIKLHGGSITVESQPGIGSCFTIKLPIIFNKNKTKAKM